MTTVLQVIQVVVFIVAAVFILVEYGGLDVYTLLVALGTAFIGLGFAFSSTLQGLMESLQMLFFGIFLTLL
jgi:small-conductance mechanosensitive channel